MLETGLLIAGYTGVITNLVYHRGDQVRMSFGFIYPTDFAAGIVFNSMDCTPTGKMHMDRNWNDDNQCGSV